MLGFTNADGSGETENDNGVKSPTIINLDGTGETKLSVSLCNGEPLWWMTGPAIPQPARLEILPDPTSVYNGGPKVRMSPTLYDSQGAIIAHAAQSWNSIGTSSGFELTPTGLLSQNSGAQNDNAQICGTNATITTCARLIVNPTNNPIDDAQTFVREQYSDFLSRSPDQGGQDYWTSQITQCGADQTCIRNKRIDVSNAFFYELEFQQTGSYVYRMYRAAYGNTQPFPNPDTSNDTERKKIPSFDVFASDRARVVGGASLAQGQSEFANAFVQRAEFLAKYSANLDASSFIDAVLATIKNDSGADLTPQKSALLSLFNQVGGGNGGRGAVMYRLADDNVATNPINNRAFIDGEYNRAFVATQYFGYLRRDADIGGFLFWLGQVNSAPLRDVLKQHAMVCSFITSMEYQQRFSSIVTHSNGECPH